MHLTKSKKWLALVLLVVTWVFLTVFSCLENPVHTTISMIGLQYPVAFGALCILLFITLLSNFAILFYAHGYTNMFSRVIASIGSFCIVITAFFPTSKEGEGLPFIVHGTAAMAFFYLIMLAMWLFLFRFRHAAPLYLAFLVLQTVVIVATLVATLLLFVVFDGKYGRTGITELVPLYLLFVIFLLGSFTPVLTCEERRNADIAMK